MNAILEFATKLQDTSSAIAEHERAIVASADRKPALTPQANE